MHIQFECLPYLPLPFPIKENFAPFGSTSLMWFSGPSLHCIPYRSFEARGVRKPLGAPVGSHCESDPPDASGCNNMLSKGTRQEVSNAWVVHLNHHNPRNHIRNHSYFIIVLGLVVTSIIQWRLSIGRPPQLDCRTDIHPPSTGSPNLRSRRVARRSHSMEPSHRLTENGTHLVVVPHQSSFDQVKSVHLKVCMG